jgi:RNA polymerase sigma-70 factor (ECF subfamily)
LPLSIGQLFEKRLDGESAPAPAPTVEQVYRNHAEFVWACLQRFGIRDRDLDDALQEVFVVVHQRLITFRGEARMTTWLYSICLRVAQAHRRRGYVRRELAVDRFADDVLHEPTNPESELAVRQRRRVLEAILDELDLEKRALLVMFEIDETPCEEIATLLGLPLGTVYSRLHGARKAFEKAVARFRARTRGGAE